MRREPDHFGDQDLSLVYIAKKLKEALGVETLLTDAGLGMKLPREQASRRRCGKRLGRCR